MSLAIDRDELISEIEALASFSDAEAPAVTRIVFTPTDLKARAWMKARCERGGARGASKMQSEIRSRGGVVLIHLRQSWALARI